MRTLVAGATAADRVQNQSVISLMFLQPHDLVHLRVSAQQGFHTKDVGHVLLAARRFKGYRFEVALDGLGFTRQRLGQAGHYQVLLQHFTPTIREHSRVDVPVLLFPFRRPPETLTLQRMGKAGGKPRPKIIPFLLLGSRPGLLNFKVVVWSVA